MIPPGWSYDPSAWSQRLPIVALALLGTAVAGYLALFQLGVIPSVWEPFFGRGSERILNSRVSHVLPIPDAALGALGYFVDAVTGAIGGRGRWRTMPWVVIVFGIAVGPLGVVSVLLVVLQPVMFDAWCTLCLASAVISLAMIGPAMDEVLASVQHLRGRTAQARRGRTGALWAQRTALAAGLALLLAPAWWGWSGPLADVMHASGAVAASIAFVAQWEITRPVRWLLWPAALAALAGLVLAWPGPTGLTALAAAAVLTLTTIPRQDAGHAYGGGWAVALGRA